MQRVDVYFCLGSNMGDREDNLETAVQAMADAFATAPRRVSATIETKAWGFSGADFLNKCVMFRLTRRTGVSPVAHALRILDQVKIIEAIMGRAEEAMVSVDGKREYHDRPIDIDILFYGTETVSEPRLTIPHPLIAQRDFVKIPLREIASEQLCKTYPYILK